MKLNLGCGGYLFGGFVNVDSAFDLSDLKKEGHVFQNAVVEEEAEFVRADIRKLPFPDGSADFILSVNALEHLPFRDVIPALQEWNRVLSRDGEMFLVVPDFDSLAMTWCQMMLEPEIHPHEYVDVIQGIYGNQITEGEFHRSLMNKKLMDSFLATAGFEWWSTQVYPRGHKWIRPKEYSIPVESADPIFRYGSIYIQTYKKGREE